MGSIPAGEMLEQTVSVRKQTKGASHERILLHKNGCPQEDHFDCIKRSDDSIVDEGTIPATSIAVKKWVKGVSRPWYGKESARIYLTR